MNLLCYTRNSLYPYNEIRKYNYSEFTIYIVHIFFQQTTIFAKWRLEWKPILLISLIIGLWIEVFIRK